MEPRSVSEFYDLLAPTYDDMTGFDRRFVQEKPFFHLLVERYGIKTALDAGCGSGFHSLLLSQLGVRVTAIDASPRMVQLTRKHARSINANVRTINGSFDDLGDLVGEQFDAVFIMGNSLPHLLTRSALKRSVQTLAGVLKPQGILFSQILNYERILARQDRIQSSKESGSKTFVRFYDYDNQGIIFNILTLEKDGSSVNQKHESIRLRPVLREELVNLLSEAGLADVKVFGGISMESFESGTSTDLVILARKRD